MANDLITNYLSAQSALLQEKSRLENRLVEISQALNQTAPVAAAAAPAPVVVRRGPGRPKGSGVKAAPPAAPKGKRTMSAAARARIAAAARARWAKVKAAKGEAPAAAAPAAAAAPKKAKRKMSAEGRARIVAATKARWARIHAEQAAKAA
ncbi:hypothetical protein LBMAG56_25910 [Verrucomicrobiota bacterium]|nr:hypothetical protein LBMAG56_25910 [Verrucomicrobiota bacterium]